MRVRRGEEGRGGRETGRQTGDRQADGQNRCMQVIIYPAASSKDSAHILKAPVVPVPQGGNVLIYDFGWYLGL